MQDLVWTAVMSQAEHLPETQEVNVAPSVIIIVSIFYFLVILFIIIEINVQPFIITKMCQAY